MSNAFVQAAAADNAAGLTSVLAYASNNTLGNLLIATARFGGSSTTAVLSVADTQVNAWSVPVLFKISTAEWGMFAFAPNCKAGANIVTVTSTVTLTGYNTIVAEYSGPPVSTPLVGSSQGSGTGTAAVSGNTPSIAAGGLLIAIALNTNTFTTNSPGGGFTFRKSNPSGLIFISDLLSSSNGPAASSSTWGNASSAWTQFVAAFGTAGTITPVGGGNGSWLSPDLKNSIRGVRT